MDLNKIYQLTILEYAKRNDLKYEIENATDIKRAHNPSCGDDITIVAKIEDDRIVDISYLGSACAICSASSAMLVELVKGLTLEKSKEIVEEFFKMMKKEDANLDILKEAEILSITKDKPARIKCATLSWHTLKTILEDKGIKI